MMRLFSLDSLLFILAFGNCVMGNIIESCDSVIKVSCGTQRIVILSINTTSNLASDWLEKCNAQHECNVSNRHKECVQLHHWCRLNDEAVEIRKSSVHFKSPVSLISVMSENFQDGQFTDGQNTNCTLRFTEKQTGKDAKMKVTIYELSTFSNCTKVCITIDNSQKQPFCSNSRELYTPYRSFDGQGLWQFYLTVTTFCSPKIRLWMELDIISHHSAMWNLYCTSSPGKDSKDIPFPPVIHIISIIGGVIGMLAPVAIGLAVCHMRWQRKSGQIQLDEHIYYNINGPNMETRIVSPEPNMSTRNLVPNISLGLQAIDNACHGSFMTILSHNRLEMDSVCSGGDVEIVENCIYGSQMTVQSNDSVISSEMNVLDNSVYGSKITIHSSDIDDTDITDNDIYGSEITVMDNASISRSCETASAMDIGRFEKAADENAKYDQDSDGQCLTDVGAAAPPNSVFAENGKLAKDNSSHDTNGNLYELTRL